jgi:large subunit ribosomal protein L10
MAKTRAAKAAEVAYLRDRLSRASTAVFTDFRGLDVARATELRGRLRRAGVEFRVVKNTLALRAAREAGIDGVEGFLEGPTAVAFSLGEPTAAARELQAYLREHPELSVRVKGGLLEGRPVGPDAVQALADLPPREVLLGRVLGAMRAPLAGLAAVLGAPIRGLAVAVDQLRQQRGAAA